MSDPSNQLEGYHHAALPHGGSVACSVPPGFAGSLGNVGLPHGGSDQSQFVPHPHINMPSMSTAPHNMPPPIPPRVDLNQAFAQQGMIPNYGHGGMGSYGGMGMGSYGMGGYGAFTPYGGGYGMGGMGGMGGMYGGYNRYGLGAPMYGDIESRFIQLAEESSRPAFDSIQSLVNAVGSVAMMLESTFFALTSSFRAILGVAENFGRLRSLFAQFWSTFAVVRTLNWMIRKLMVIIGIRTETEFKAWAEAVASSQQLQAPNTAGPRLTGWPVLMFFGVVAAAPYLVFKMLSGLSKSINENLQDPTTWQQPIRAIAQYNFTGNSPQQLPFQEKQTLTVAPQNLQPQLWNSGWLMATIDGKTTGLVPANYIKLIKPKIEGDVQDPTTWQQPIRAIAQYNFTGNSPQQLPFQEKQTLTVAPQNLQPQLWNSGWLMATIDGKTTGLVPVNYIKLIKPKIEGDGKNNVAESKETTE